MNDNIEKNVEYIGYGKMAALLFKLSKWLSIPATMLKRTADKLRFEQYKMKFGERDDDIYIVTFPKSGTTLTQMILYQLTTDGNTDFNHIYDVSPWIKNSSLKGIPPSDLPSPRIIKSHDYYGHFNKKNKGRFIFVYRNGMDVAVSLYHQNKNYNFSDLQFDKFIGNFLKKRRKNWFSFTKQWLTNKNKLPILYIQYENLLENKEQEIRRIIDFCHLPADEHAIQRALKFSSFEFMKEHQDKFGEQPTNTKVFDQFIRKGKQGEGEEMFSEEQEQVFGKYYDEALKDKVKLIF